MSWEVVAPGVWRFRDSCNVWAIDAPEGPLIVDAGTGDWIDALGDLPRRPSALLCTHYLRDHSAGAARAAQEGIPVWVPEYERAIFADPVQHFAQRETYIVYDNLWDLFAPILPTRIAGVLRDYEHLRIGGREVEIVPLPGATYSQIGIATTLPDGRRGVFCGEAIHSPGRLARIAPLQYNYNDLSGAAQAHLAAQTLREHAPDVLYPSLGEPIESEVDGALAALQQTLRALAQRRPGMVNTLDGQAPQPLVRVTDHVWLDPQSCANTWFVLSDSGKALAIDYGYATPAMAWSGYPKPERRRALLHGLEGLRQLGIDRIDVVLVSHFHDDHVCGIPVLQRRFGTQCWASDCFADLLEQPSAHCFPCNWPTPARIDRRLPSHTPIPWEEYEFTLAPMSGHTRFASLIGFEADGRRFAHTGDQYFFVDGHENFAANRRLQNHVYRNGALLDGYRQSGAWLSAWRPEIVLQGHQPAFVTDDAFFAHIAAWDDDYAKLHAQAMPLAPTDCHFDLDSLGGWLWPYRVHQTDASPIDLTATLRNPLPTTATLTARLVGPGGWVGPVAQKTLPGHTEDTLPLTLVPPPGTRCRRQPIALELRADGRPLGQVAEALVTIGYEEF